jgi:ABC-type branched-subunit amino acid transport system substrate-binding protein
MLKKSMLLLLLLALTLPGLSLVSAQDDCNFAEETLKVGSLMPLSAPGAVLSGEQMRWTFLRGADDVNAACGVTVDGQNYAIEIIIGDSEGLPERSQAVAERMIFEDGVVGVVGVFHSAVGLATMGVMQANGIPTVFSEPWNDNVTANGIMPYGNAGPRVESNEAGIDYIFRISPASSMTSEASVAWLLHLGVDDVVIVAENTDYGVPAADKDKELLIEGGLDPDNVDIFHIELGQEDFLPLIDRILARPDPTDVIKTQITGETALNFVNQMTEAGLAPNEDTICVANQNAYQADAYWTTVPDGNYCTFFRVGIVPALLTPLAQRLNDDHFAEFGVDVASFALASYDAVWLLTDAITRANTLDGTAIALEIERSDVSLSQGRYWFPYTTQTKSPLDDGLPAWMWHQWPDPAVTMMQFFRTGQRGPEAAVIWPPAYWTHDTAYIEFGSDPEAE